MICTHNFFYFKWLLKYYSVIAVSKEIIIFWKILKYLLYLYNKYYIAINIIFYLCILKTILKIFFFLPSSLFGKGTNILHKFTSFYFKLMGNIKGNQFAIYTYFHSILDCWYWILQLKPFMYQQSIYYLLRSVTQIDVCLKYL